MPTVGWSNKSLQRNKTLKERFIEKVAVGDDCWEWLGGKNSKQYGAIRVNGVQTPAHRVSYSIHVGPIPDGLWVLHHCDNPSCVNPQHLFLGTCKDNVDDMMAKGRHKYESKPPKGSKSPHAKITEDDVLTIRHLVKNGAQQNILAREYGIGTTQMNRIVRRKSWRHI